MISNCLIEAVKAKIKNPQNVKIHYIPAKLNNGNLHFYWYDFADQSIFQFTHKANVKSSNILFNGETGSFNIKLFESRMYAKMKELGWSYEQQKSYANKKGFCNPEPFSIKVQKGH